MRKAVLMLLLAQVAAPALAQKEKEEERYLCIATAAGGVSYEPARKSWTGGPFNIKDKKFTLAKQGGKWRWNEFGTNFGWDCGDFNDASVIACGEQWLNPIIFSRRTMRFRSAYLPGYTDGKDDNSDTPAITIGTCSKF
jgi:hypothetical protein